MDDQPDDTAAYAARVIADGNRHVARGLEAKARKAGTDARLAKLETNARLVARTLGQLAGAVSRLTDQRLDPTAPAPATTPASDDELVEWVNWLVDRYDLRYKVPDCWARHGAIVEELDALRLAWLATVANPNPGLGAVQWHDALDRVTERISRRNGCRSGHDEGVPYPWSGQLPDGVRIDLHASRYQPDRSAEPVADS